MCPLYSSGPISAHLLANVETVAVGMTVAVLVFPLQCFLCFLFRKAHSRVIKNSINFLFIYLFLLVNLFKVT